MNVELECTIAGLSFAPTGDGEVVVTSTATGEEVGRTTVAAAIVQVGHLAAMLDVAGVAGSK